MKKLKIFILLIVIIFVSCGNSAKTNENNDLAKDTIVEKEIDFVSQSDKKVGKELFDAILDTINIQSISVYFLITNEWFFEPFDSCKSYLKFFNNGKGIDYNCEMEEEYEITYRIEENRIYISEFDTPHVDNPEGKKIKSRDDIYVYNGHSLIMINSKMYSVSGVEWIPKVEVVINYDRKTN